MSALIEAAREIASLRAALKWYADGEHFTKSQPDAWDTVSGEPVNWWCDEAGTAMIEDGSLAGMVLAGKLSGEQLGALEDGEVAAAEAQPVGEPVAPHPSAMKRGGRYNWKGQPERLEYLGKKGSWHQFAKVGRIGEVWCEVLGGDLHMLEETAPPVQPAAPLTDEQIQALVLATVYDGDCSTPHRDAWAAEIGVPFARAIERAHGIGSQP